MLQRFDGWVIDRIFQPLAYRLRRFGTPHGLGRSLVIGSAALIAGSAYQHWQAGSITPGMVFGNGLTMASHLVIASPMTSASEGTIPWQRAWLWPLRLLALLTWIPCGLTLPLILLSAFLGFENGASVLFSLYVNASFFGLYFLACQDTPPLARREAAKQSELASNLS